jgi:hypothetical protein
MKTVCRLPQLMSRYLSPHACLEAALEVYSGEKSNEMFAIRRNRARVVSASICLLAVVLLYTPMVAAVWTVHTMSCCTGDHCPISGHHHQKSSAAPAHHMNCGHEMSSMMACSMSCCQTTDHSLVASIFFVLPGPSVVPALSLISPASKSAQAILSSDSFKPLSPPPRFAAAVLS